MSLFFLLARNYYKRTKYPFFAQCKATQNKIAWAHCMFFADHVAKLSGARNFQRPKLPSITDNYRQLPTSVIAAKFYVQFIQDFLHWPLYQSLLTVQSIKLIPVGKLVPLDRIERSRHFWQQILSLLCLPIPP